ncbi:hypothetical protein [Methylobacterium sp. AMS5]|uniref:hypothetical protein n=1 Tax=Methylobacterium sp. AMS5 TaxID=925818 RepID=UPI00074F9A71|nr:hypothetical protein [Methylobacterium sp. AMS5]AMB48352.1 hypothetical protein Y590_25625 [Methylobacterium sp. AMS5]
MRPGSNVTITFDDGTVFKGQLGNCEMRAAETMRFEECGDATPHRVVTRPASMTLEVYSREFMTDLTPAIRRYPNFPMDPAPLPAPEPEDVPENWGAYA